MSFKRQATGPPTLPPVSSASAGVRTAARVSAWAGPFHRPSNVGSPLGPKTSSSSRTPSSFRSSATFFRSGRTGFGSKVRLAWTMHCTWFRRRNDR